MKSNARNFQVTVLVAAAGTLLALTRLASGAGSDVPSQLIRYADLVLHSGQVLTVDADFTVAEALAVRDGRVLAVGSSADMLRLAGPGTERVDLAGRSVTPGYIYNDGDNAVPGGDIYKDTMVGGWLSGRIPGDDMEILLSSLDDVLRKAEPAEVTRVAHQLIRFGRRRGIVRRDERAHKRRTGVDPLVLARRVAGGEVAQLARGADRAPGGVVVGVDVWTELGEQRAELERRARGDIGRFLQILLVRRG